MPFWLLILLGAGLVYLVKQGQSQAAASTGTPQLPGTFSDASTSSSGTGIGAEDFGPPPPAQALATGSSYTVPSGTKLFSDSKLTQSAGSVMSSGGTGLNVTITGSSVAADGSISASYVDQGSNKTMWFSQPGS
jgi:hypothetical protein